MYLLLVVVVFSHWFFSVFAHIVLMFLSIFYSIFIHITIFMLNMRCPWGSSICCRTSGQIHDVFWHQILSPIKSWKSRVGRARTVCNNSELEACKVFLFLSHLDSFQHSESTWCSRADWELTLNFQHRHHRPHLMFTSNAHGLVIWTEHYFALHPSLHFRELTRLNSTTFFSSLDPDESVARGLLYTLEELFVVSWAFAWKSEVLVWVNEVESEERKEEKLWERRIF